MVKENQTDKGCSGFDSWKHWVSKLFCHFVKSTLVRDISTGLHFVISDLIILHC
ncbi:DUF4372 domain-containing protein [Peijinzhouia sedimentorum]